MLAQTHVDWEWLIAEDGSRDDTPIMMQQFAQNDARIKPIFLSTNGGPAAARQAALEQAQGRFIAFLDADDLWLPEKLERQLAFMVQKNAAISYTAYRRMNENGEKIGNVITIPHSLTYRQLLANTAMACSTVVIDRERAGDFHIKNEDYDDFITWLDITRRGFTAYGLADDLMRYRVRKASDSSDKIKAIRRVWHIYRAVEKLSLASAMQAMVGYAVNAMIKRIKARW